MGIGKSEQGEITQVEVDKLNEKRLFDGIHREYFLLDGLFAEIIIDTRAARSWQRRREVIK